MNRDRVERVVTNELNGRELHIPTERLQREAEQALRGRSAHETNQNYRTYNEMAARAHLPQLELIDERGPVHQRRAERHPQPHRSARPGAGEELPVPPIQPGAPGSEAPITPPDNREPLPPTVTPRTNLEPTVNEPGAMPYRNNSGLLLSEGDLAPRMNSDARDYQFHPLNPPGLDNLSLSGKSPDQRFQGNGEVTSQYRGDANTLSAMYTFNASRTTDAAGHILAEHVDYNGSGPMFISGPDGSTQRLENVRSIDTRYNPSTNTYRTEYLSQDGTLHVSTATGEGRVASFDRVSHR